MQPVTVELSDEDLQFVETHNRSLESLLASAISRERRQYEYEHPTPDLTERAINIITRVHRAALEGDSVIGQQPLTSRRLSVSARPLGGTYVLEISVGEVDRLAGADINDTMAESGEFLAEVSRNLGDLLADLNGTSPDEFEFELSDHEVSPLGVEEAAFRIEVHPSRYADE